MKKFRLTAIFLAVVVILQGAAVLFLTHSGLELVFSLPLRLNAEKFKPENNTYVVYYDMRTEVSDADLIVVGVDPNIAESYDILGHFTRFLKQYNNLSAVMFDFDKLQNTIATKLFEEEDRTRFYAKLSTLGSGGGLSQSYLDYLSELYAVNVTMPPVRKFELVSYNVGESDGALAQRVASEFSKVERSALCIVDSLEFSADSSFRDELDAAIPDKKIVYIEAVYTRSCPSPETHDTVGFPFESGESSVYFVNNGDLSSFYNYYSSVVGLFGTDKNLKNRLDTRFTDYFFVISRGNSAE